MELNSFLFPAPQPSYDSNSFKSEMIWVPNEARRGRAPIPCLYLRCLRGSSKVLLYFHGNAEDVGLAYDLMDHLRNTLMVIPTQVHVVAMEYPGYGIYPGEPSADRILQDADVVFNYLTNHVGLNPRNIVLFGRSIGSGPATWLGSEKKPGALLLMSAYTSIRAVVKNIAGSMIQYLVADRFKNIDMMPRVTCPTFLVHGQRDTLIPFQNSQELHEVCGGPCSLVLPKEMDHNEFDFFDDLSIPFSSFLMQCGISVYPKRGEPDFPMFPAEIFDAPDHPPEALPKGTWNRLYRMFS